MRPTLKDRRAQIKELEICRDMIEKAGDSIGAPKPYKLLAVYQDDRDPLIKFAVFSDANGRQFRTGRFKLVYASKNDMH